MRTSKVTERDLSQPSACGLWHTVITSASTVAMALVLAACGSSGGSQPSGGQQAAQQPGSCTIYDSGHDARITATSGGQAECQTLATDLSSGGDFWTFEPQQTSDQLSTVCVMDSSSGDVAQVIDGGGQYIGQPICSSMLSNGWTEDTSAEQQQAQATASASASASRQAANAQAEQTAQNDLSTLRGVSFSSDLGKLAADVSQTNSDLAKEKSDAASGVDGPGGPSCYNLEQNVDYDATQNVEYDETQNLGYDLQQNLSPDISTARGDIATPNNDLSSLSASGLPAPAGASAAIAAAQQAIREAISQANGYIDQVNADVNTAYAIGNNMATSTCTGPGSPPPPVSHVS